MLKETFDDQDWFDQLYDTSESTRTVDCAKTSLRLFDHFCASQNMFNGIG
ncbi:MAG: hypothetical protein OEM77_00320 [Nitrosopumilus sp.]|nr:hypothetical protein [Nitrosopumilus sp.]MDH3735989.1 hypothetical protein [Nitrosopumilus sp.]